MMTTHISRAWDGAIVRFPGSKDFFMKTCTRDGIGGVVNLRNGLYVPARDLIRYELGERVTIVAMNLEDFVTDKEEN